MAYLKLNLKNPIESADYEACSHFITESVTKIMSDAMDSGRNQIVIHTNLRLGIPIENINKIAGPFVEAWAFQTFADALNDGTNSYELLNVEAGERLNMSDVILQFRRVRPRSTVVTGNVDIKATSSEIEGSSTGLNVSSFVRIRSAYVADPDYFFIILSIKHQVFRSRDGTTNTMMGVMEVVDFKAYDLKYIAASDINYNPEAVGAGQLQLRDIHYVQFEKRTTSEFCHLLDKKFLATKKSYQKWLELAKQYEWIKDEPP
ncbi:MAG: hypothetical protein QM533_00050 [Cytophagales bacterium]|nr:hypothetical protein [Cytophagales bacterium]